MGLVNLSGHLPDGESNGLAAIVRELVENPAKAHVLLCIVDAQKITENVDDGTRTPTVRVRRCEPISDPDDAMTMRRVLVRGYERRTGKAVLPFDLETDLRDIFDEGTTDGS
jgi:hypothetical protein